MLDLLFGLISLMFTLILMFMKLVVRFGLLLATTLIAAFRDARSDTRRR